MISGRLLAADTLQALAQHARALGHIASGPIKIGSKTKIRSNPGTNVYLNPIAPPIATYENGDAAIVGRSFETGQSYALGIDLGQLLPPTP